MNKYYTAALSAFVIWGFIGLLLRPLHIYASLDILFYRVLFSAAIIAVMVFIFSPKQVKRNIKLFKELDKPLQKQTLINTLGGGLLLTFNWFFFIYVMNHISIKAASYAYIICPVITTVLAFFILKEKLSQVQWIAVSISLVSCLILAFSNLNDLIFSLIVATSYALYLVTQRNNEYLEKLFILALQLVFAALCTLPFFPFFVSGTVLPFSFFVSITILALLFTILPLWLNLYALIGVNSSTMGVLLYINPLLNFILAVVVFDEKTNALQVAGYTTILLSVFVFNYEKISSLVKK